MQKNNRLGCFWDNLSVAGRSIRFTFFKTGGYLKVTYMEKIFLIFIFQLPIRHDQRRRVTFF